MGSVDHVSIRAGDIRIGAGGTINAGPVTIGKGGSVGVKMDRKPVGNLHWASKPIRIKYVLLPFYLLNQTACPRVLSS